jgi:hypothetical protein
MFTIATACLWQNSERQHEPLPMAESEKLHGTQKSCTDMIDQHMVFKGSLWSITMYEAGLTYSIVAGVMSICLLFYAVKKKDEHYFLFSLMFLIISWSGIEWALWLKGYNLFEMVFVPIVPLASYFVGWTLFVVYIAERHFKRRDWIAFLLVLAFFIWISTFCMNCLVT